MSFIPTSKLITHFICILHEILNVVLGIDLIGRVGTLLSKLWICTNLEREALAVGDVPIQDAELGASMISLMLFGWHVMMRTYFHPRHRVQRAFDV